MIELYNNHYRVTGDRDTIFELARTLSIVDKKCETITRVFTMESDNCMIIPRGVGRFLPQLQDYKDKTTNELNITEIPDDISHILPGITLREDQVIAVQKMILAKRGVIQMATGVGKSECIVAFIKLLSDLLGYTPTTLVITPTVRLVDDTIKRFKKYDMIATKYSARRGFVEGVVVAHPKSINNDLLNSDKDLLKGVKILVADEGHHTICTTWRRVIEYAPDLEYSIGMTATAIDRKRLPISEHQDELTGEEWLIVGATGDVLLDIPPSYYIEKGILANPVLIRMSNKANQRVARKRDWHCIRKTVLESSKRLELASQVVAFFSGLHYKSLILVDTKDSAINMLKILHQFGMDDISRASFGSGVFMKWDPEINTAVSVDKDEDTLGMFERGELTILAGTQHILEGWDAPNLDVVVLYSVGKSVRRVVQGVGRGLRRTKTGKHAYIIDFTDHENGILGNHSIQRLQTFRSVIGVPESQIYHNVEFTTLKCIIADLEELW